MKTRGKLYCKLCMKERIEIIDNLQRRYIRIINAEHAVTFQDSIGLTSTDDPLKGEKVVNFKISKLTKKKNGFQLVEQIWKMRSSQPLRGYF